MLLCAYAGYAGEKLRQGSGKVIGGAAAVIEAAAAKHEGSKCAFVDAGVHVQLIDAAAAVPPGGGSGGDAGDSVVPSAVALAAICNALRSFATADDLRPSTSR